MPIRYADLTGFACQNFSSCEHADEFEICETDGNALFPPMCPECDEPLVAVDRVNYGPAFHERG